MVRDRHFLQQRDKQRGSASIFVVIFTMLIISTIVIGFTGIILRDQSEASDVDLSETAYDSALAGVEDAKRSVSKYLKYCGEGGTGSVSDCNTWRNAFTNCNANNVILYGSSSNQERLITTVSGSSKQIELNQAYTCVKIAMDTPNYLGNDLPDGQQAFIPLRGTGDFSTIRISWFSRDNINRESSGSTADQVSLSAPVDETVTAPALPYNNTTNWPTNRPPVLRAQYIQVPNNFNLTDFDETSTDGLESNTNSLFMYPTRGSLANRGALSDIAPRFNNVATSWQVSCKNTVTDDSYACSAELTVPATYGGGNKASAYLVLRPFYNLTDYRIELLGAGGAIVNFSGVQPLVDSTGRANDIFRRVSARIETASGANVMPVGAVETTGNFCKTFSVTDDLSGYSSGGCDPNEGL